MERVLFKILKILPPICKSYILKVYPKRFWRNERIVRIIYSERHINPNKKTLKDNFFNFSPHPITGIKELSCNRFEIESVEYLRMLGKLRSQPEYKRNYYGIACTTIEKIKSLNYSAAFTPIINESPKNYTHTDLYDFFDYQIQVGVANNAEVNLIRHSFKQIWSPHKDEGSDYVHHKISAP